MEPRVNDELIEKYLDGDLQDAALKEFEEKLKSDANLAKRLKFHQEMAITLEDSKGIDIQKQLVEIGQSYFSTVDTDTPVRKIVPIWRKPLAIAASVLVLLAASYFTWQAVSDLAPSGERLFAQNFEKQSLENIVRGNDQGTASEETDFEKAVDQYMAGQYTEASLIFRGLLSQDPENESLKFSLAQSLLNEEPPGFAEATPLLHSLATSGKSNQVTAAKWYLALIYVRAGDFNQATPLLEEVKEVGGKRGKQAEQILEQLK